jgi:hypothetical protein
MRIKESNSGSEEVPRGQIDTIFDEFQAKIDQIYREHGISPGSNTPIVTTRKVRRFGGRVSLLAFRGGVSSHTVTIHNDRGLRLRQHCLENPEGEKSIAIYDDTPKRKGGLSRIIEASIEPDRFADVEESIAWRRQAGSTSLIDKMRDKWIQMFGDTFETVRPLRRSTVQLFRSAIDGAASGNEFIVER